MMLLTPLEKSLPENIFLMAINPTEIISLQPGKSHTTSSW